VPVDLSIKRVPDEVARKLRKRADENHRSLQGELMAILQQAVESAAASRASIARESPAVLSRRGRARQIPVASESALIIRQAREGRTFSAADLHRYVSALGTATPDEATAWIRQERSRR
jgi:plasmid stability protein